MAALDFPNSPTIGQAYTTSLGAIYKWDGVKWATAVGTNAYLVDAPSDGTLYGRNSGGWVNALPLYGGTMLGELILNSDPINNLDAATKNYVDLLMLEAALTIGEIKLFAGGTPPANWIACDGTVYNNVDYPLLFSVIGYTYGGDGVSTFAVPNLTGRVPLGTDHSTSYPIGSYGGEINHTLSWDEMPAHAHGVADPTHAHSIYDPSHVHGLGDPGHAHSVADPGHAHGASQGAHTHGLDHQVGTSSGGPNVAGGALWLITTVRTDSQAPPTYTSGAGVSIGIYGAGTGMWVGYAGTGIGIYGAATGISIYNAGSSWGHNNMQPYVSVLYIIRFR
jgi:microcystin-dependent protein